MAMRERLDCAVLGHKMVCCGLCFLDLEGMAEGGRKLAGFRGRDREAAGWLWRAGTMVLHVQSG